MNSTNANTSTVEDQIDIFQLFRTIWSGKWLILLTMLVAGAIGAAYAILTTPIYSGNALLQVETKSGGFAGLTGLAEAFGAGDGAGSETTTELEILKSRKVIVPTIEKFGLKIMAMPKTFPIIGDYFFRKYGNKTEFSEPLLTEYFAFTKHYAWGGEKIIVNQFEVPEQYLEEEFEIILLAEEKYTLNFEGERIFEGEVGVRKHIPDWNIDIQVGKLEGRIGTYFTLQRLDYIMVIDELVNKLIVSEKGKLSGIVAISMQGPDKKLIKDIIDDVLSTYQQQNVEYNSDEAERSLSFVESQLPETTQNMRKAERKIYEYRLNNKTVDLTLQTEQLLNQLLAIEEGLNELNLQEPELSRKFKRKHPIFIEFLRKKADLEAKRDDVNLQTGQIPTEQFNIFRLERDVQLNQKIYLQMLNRYEELKIIKAGALGSIRIIDNTIVRSRAVKPQKMLIVIVSILVGFILSVVYILLRAMLSKGIKSIDQLEELGYDVYASIATSAVEEKLSKQKPMPNVIKVLSHLHPEQLTVEALRSLRTSLHFAMMEAKNNIVMITGPSPNIGKSFISQNLAVLIAQSDNKVLLVDVDMRRGSVHDSFGMDIKPGLSDLLFGNAKFDEVCRETGIKGLDVIACGKKPSNPSELLMSKRFAEFCETHKDKYDFIILDTPPILAVTDASIIGRFAGTSMMVVKQNINHLQEIVLATQKLKLVDIEIKGYVFNSANAKNRSANNYQYSYT